MKNQTKLNMLKKKSILIKKFLKINIVHKIFLFVIYFFKDNWSLKIGNFFFHFFCIQSKINHSLGFLVVTLFSDTHFPEILYGPNVLTHCNTMSKFLLFSVKSDTAALDDTFFCFQKPNEGFIRLNLFNASRRRTEYTVYRVLPYQMPASEPTRLLNRAAPIIYAWPRLTLIYNANLNFSDEIKCTLFFNSIFVISFLT